MSDLSVPDPRALKLYSGVSAHLAFVATRDAAACIVCGACFEDDQPVPACERCGLEAFHFECYVEAIATEPDEEAFFAKAEDDGTEPLVIFLCPGCRS